MLKKLTTDILSKLGLLVETFFETKITIDGFSIAYKGTCLIKQEKHKSNNCYLKFTKGTIYIRCFDHKCDRTAVFKTNEVLCLSFYSYLFKKGFMQEEALNYIKTSVDAGVETLTEDTGMFSAPATDKLIAKYVGPTTNDSPVHMINGISHVLKYATLSCFVTEYASSNICKVINNIQINNITLTQNFIHATGGKISTNEKADEQLQGYSFIKRSKELLELYSEPNQKLLIEFSERMSSACLANIFLASDSAKSFIYCNVDLYLKKNNIWKLTKDPKLVSSIILETIVAFIEPFFSMVFTHTRFKKQRPAMQNLAKRIESSNTLTSIENNIYLAKQDDSFLLKLDKALKLLPFFNGIYDLQTKQFREYTDHDFFPNVSNLISKEQKIIQLLKKS